MSAILSPTTTNARLADTLALVEECITDIALAEHDGASIAVVLEGVKLSRNGRVSLMQLKASYSSVIWIVDITVLGQSVFTYPSSTTGVTLQQILESREIKKIFYDVRRDADALYNNHGIDMQNVVDVQMTELALRKSLGQPTRLLNGLARSITCYLSPGPQWRRTKDLGVSLFAPEKGGSYEVFERRPLHPTLIAYSAQDVALLAQLERVLVGRMGPVQLVGRQRVGWDTRVETASSRRLLEAKSLYFDQEGPHRALSPSI